MIAAKTPPETPGKINPKAMMTPLKNLIKKFSCFIFILPVNVLYKLSYQI
jgi:hypothetical protein